MTLVRFISDFEWYAILKKNSTSLNMKNLYFVGHRKIYIFFPSKKKNTSGKIDER